MNKKSNVSNTRKTPKDKLDGLLSDAVFLANFAVENDQLPEEVSMGALYRMQAAFAAEGRLDDADVDVLAQYYASLQHRLAPVTAISLAATDCHGVEDCMSTEAGRHAQRMWSVAFLVVALIVALNLWQYVYEFNSTDWATTHPDRLALASALYMLAVYASPFLYGALGACVHILRATERNLRQRTFDPRRIPQHRNRLVLGTLSGGAIVLFVTADGGSDTALALTAAASGFLAGYSIDFLFAILDRVLSAVVPPSSEQQVEPSAPPFKASELQYPTGDTAQPRRRTEPSESPRPVPAAAPPATPVAATLATDGGANLSPKQPERQAESVGQAD